MSTPQTLRPIPILSLLILTLLIGCSDTTDPGLDGNNGTGLIDPADGSFVFKAVDVTVPDGRHLRLELVGSDLALDDDGIHVDLTVAVRNAANMALSGPLTLWLGPFEPVSVFVANPDTSLPVGSIIPVDGFIYDTEFGNDLILQPGETSEGKSWRFRTTDQGSFSFGIRAVPSGEPSGSVISGNCFWDTNRNGIQDPDETPLAPGQIHVIAPDSTQVDIFVDQDGRYVYPLHVAGLHRVEYMPFWDSFTPLVFTTPNPRHVLITPGPDGVLRGFHDAHFGAYFDDPPGPPFIQFTDLPADSLHYELWNLIEVSILREHLLRLEVGFSGCQPEHPFSLWMTGGFMESMPVQVNLVPVHELAEDCDMYFTGERVFNLMPLRERFLEAYGPGVLVLNVIDFTGEVHRVEWGIFPPD